jgi:arsenate reductase
MTTIYGIKNCDTMKKALAWLDDHGIVYRFHDYKAAGIDAATLKAWSMQVGWEALLNTRGTTWRKLAPAQQADVDEAKAIRLMAASPSHIKRPVLEGAGPLLVGFAPDKYAAALAR